jgi:hypothetical protein
MSRLEEALDAKYRKRRSGIFIGPDGTEKKLFGENP